MNALCEFCNKPLVSPPKTCPRPALHRPEQQDGEDQQGHDAFEGLTIDITDLNYKVNDTPVEEEPKTTMTDTEFDTMISSSSSLNLGQLFKKAVQNKVIYTQTTYAY